MPSPVLTPEQRDRKRARDRARIAALAGTRTLDKLPPDQREAKRLRDQQRQAWRQAHRWYLRWCDQEGIR